MIKRLTEDIQRYIQAVTRAIIVLIGGKQSIKNKLGCLFLFPFTSLSREEYLRVVDMIQSSERVARGCANGY